MSRVGGFFEVGWSMARLSHPRHYTARVKERELDPRRLDVKQLAHQSANLHGVWPQEQFKRLTADTLPLLADAPQTEVQWSVSCEERAVTGGVPQVWLHLKANTLIRLECQRCLMPMTARMNIDRHFLFARDEDQAAQLDEESEDDVLVLVRQLDLTELVEDELILALPIVPRHQVCPQPLMQGSDNGTDESTLIEDKPPHPFAALAALKKSTTPK